MELHNELMLSPSPRRSLAVRDAVAMLFRRKRFIVKAFLATLGMCLLAIILTPNKYEAELKLLVKRDRSDAIVSSGKDVAAPMTVRPLTEQEINSEVDLLRSRELLTKVVEATGLNAQRATWQSRVLQRSAISNGDKQRATAKAVDALQGALTIVPPSKSNLITVQYRSSDPQRSAKVLNELGRIYLMKHAELQRTPGAFDFFQQQAAEAQKDLAFAEARLNSFNSAKGVVSAETEKNNAVQQISAFEASQKQSHAALAETDKRIAMLEQQIKETPARIVTQAREPTNTRQELEATLHTLRLKRTELLQKYAPSYRAVQDIEGQIAETTAAIAEAKAKPIVEPTTDMNPLYVWLTNELAKNRAERSALKGRLGQTSRAIAEYRSNAVSLDSQQIQQQRLQRAVQEADERYKLYTQKQEEARIASELDRNQIFNVVIAEAATVPALPKMDLKTLLALAVVLALVVAFGSAFVIDLFDRSIRTPQELEACVMLPVLAAVPESELQSTPLLRL